MRRMEGDAFSDVHLQPVETSGRSVSSRKIFFKQVNPEEVEG